VTASATIPACLVRAASEDTVEFRFHLEQGMVAIPAAELAERADRGARRLIARGLQPGDVVGILGPNRPEWLVWAHAAWMAGAAVAPMQIPLRIRRPDAYAERLRKLARAAGARFVLADPQLAPLLPAEIAVPWEESGEQSAEPPEAPRAESTAVIQFTSGSTAAPKGVVLPHGAMTAQLGFIFEHYYEGHPIGSTVSWAPFFHDLGLVVSVLLSTRSRSPIEILPTEVFARDPAEWLRLLERTRALGTLGPSSAFGAAIRAASRRGERYDLSSLLVAHFAAEGVDPGVAQRMAETGVRDFSLPPEALGSTYGLAEAVLGVSYSPFGGGMKFDRISLGELAEHGVAAPTGAEPSRLMVSCGTPVMEVRIVAESGEELPERHVGEILVRGPSLMSGYLGADAPNPFVDGCLRTGDMGYLAEGELYVTGRAKDMVIVMGQNYYPEDFEWAAGRVRGVRVGRCAAFVEARTERVVVLVEPSDSNADAEALKRDVRAAIADTVGVRPGEVAVVPRGTVEKTTSGKLRRTAMREAYAAGDIAAAGAGLR
jgi:acyl-CoA synthetase (AMP-forming)/AMP-acid ligase II